jgi:hypothetical protein
MYWICLAQNLKYSQRFWDLWTFGTQICTDGDRLDPHPMQICLEIHMEYTAFLVMLYMTKWWLNYSIKYNRKCQYSWCCYNSSKYMDTTWDRIIQGHYFMGQLPSTFTQTTSVSVAFVTIPVFHQLEYSALVHSIAVNIRFHPLYFKKLPEVF